MSILVLDCNALWTCGSTTTLPKKNTISTSRADVSPEDGENKFLRNAFIYPHGITIQNINNYTVMSYQNNSNRYRKGCNNKLSRPWTATGITQTTTVLSAWRCNQVWRRTSVTIKCWLYLQEPLQRALCPRRWSSIVIRPLVHNPGNHNYWLCARAVRFHE
jgi:hypothetical protein